MPPHDLSNFTITVSPGIHNINAHIKEILIPDLIFNPPSPKSSANEKLEVGIGKESKSLLEFLREHRVKKWRLSHLVEA